MGRTVADSVIVSIVRLFQEELRVLRLVKPPPPISVIPSVCQLADLSPAVHCLVDADSPRRGNREFVAFRTHRAVRHGERVAPSTGDARGMARRMRAARLRRAVRRTVGCDACAVRVAGEEPKALVGA